ncbi:MAG: DNA internalization-related competence protein ComEC/Rec2 [Deltaproteobacteria bacterium]|nr:MAG: DNA internalization-related competence protein ComEC/Rec2 [Deltaproteobacteria bacterium]
MGNFIKRPFIPISIFFAAGIIAGENINLSFFLSFLIIIIISVILLFYVKAEKQSFLFPCLLFIFLGVLFITPCNKFNFYKKAEKLHLYSSEKQVITGVLSSLPVKKKFRRKYDLLLVMLGEQNIAKKNIRIKMTIYGHGNELKTGDIIRFKSKIKKFRNFKNPDAFDYNSYMRHKGYFGFCHSSSGKIKIVGKDKSFKSGVLRLRQKIISIIEEQVKDPDNSAFLIAVVAGKKDFLSKKFKDCVIDSGAAHFLAVSGLHVGMIFGFSYFLVRFVFSYIPFFLWHGFLRKASISAAIICCLGYGFISGFMPSAKRAVLMLLLFAAGLLRNKRTDPLNILFACGFFILVISPSSLFDISFILSFCAVFFIIFGFMLFPEKKQGRPTFFQKWLRWIKISFKTTVFAISGTYPFSLYFFNNLALAGPLTTLLLIPLFSVLILPFAFAGILLYFISHKISLIFFAISSQGVNLFSLLIEFISHFNFLVIHAGITETELLIIFAWLFFLFFLFGRKKEIFKSGYSISFLCVLFLITASDFYFEYTKRFDKKKGRVIFFDIGKGNSGLVVFPGGKTLLVDAGGFPNSDFDTGKFIIAPYLFRNKIKTIDYAVSTHGHVDHYQGFFYLLDKFNIKNFFFNRTISDSSAYKKLMSIAKNKSIYRQNKKILLERGYIDFFQRKEDFDNENDNSLLIKAVIDNIKILFTGDLYFQSQKYYCKKIFIENIDIFMVPHHGSRHSFNKEFILKSNPEIAVISGSFINYSKTQEIITRKYENLGIEVYNINLEGAFEAFINGKQIN